MSEQDKAVKLLKRIDCLFNCKERTQKETRWAELCDFLLPTQSGTFRRTGRASDGAGQKKTNKLFTSFPIDQAQKLASALQQVLTNQATVWSKYKETRTKLNDIAEVNTYLEDTNSIIHGILNESNFYTESPKAYQFDVVLGNMVIFHEEKEPIEGSLKYPGWKFTCIHLSQVAWAENKDGYVDKVAYKFELTAEQAVDKYGDKVSDRIKEAAKNHPDQKFLFVLWVAPRASNKINKKQLEKTLKTSPKERPFEACTLEYDSKHEVLEDGYYEFPFYCGRWDILPGEVTGTGRGEIALPDIKSLNKLAQQSMIAVDKDINPVTYVNQRDVTGSLSQKPGTFNVVRDTANIKEMVSNARSDRVQFMWEKLEQNIKAMFFIDQILLPPREDIGQMREVEVLQRIKQIHTVFGPVIPRMNVEFLTPLMTNCFKKALRAGVLPELPTDLREQGLSVEVVFMNELATAQKMTAVTTNQQFVQQIAGFASLSPTVLDIINFDQLGYDDGRAMGVSEKILRTDKEVSDMRAARDKQQQQQMALQSANIAADTAAKAKNASPDSGAPV